MTLKKTIGYSLITLWIVWVLFDTYKNFHADYGVIASIGLTLLCIVALFIVIGIINWLTK